MTDREKAIVMAYTGIVMLTGDKFEVFHKYVEDIMGRPAFTHEFVPCAEEIKEKAKPDFMKLCEVTGGRHYGKWIISEVCCPYCWEYFDTYAYNEGELEKCPCCGKDMERGQ